MKKDILILVHYCFTIVHYYVPLWPEQSPICGWIFPNRTYLARSRSIQKVCDLIFKICLYKRHTVDWGITRSWSMCLIDVYGLDSTVFLIMKTFSADIRSCPVLLFSHAQFAFPNSLQCWRALSNRSLRPIIPFLEDGLYRTVLQPAALNVTGNRTPLAVRLPFFVFG